MDEAHQRTAAWPTDWLRGVLPLAVLGVLADGETYGYAISQRLKASGVGDVKGGTLYPLLQRLQTDGLVLSQWRQGDSGPGRKYFELTDAGRTELRRRSATWVEFTRTITDLLEAKEMS